MEIQTAYSQTTQATQPAAGIGAQTDYLTFLNMLTVQMQNQDPLNPMAATDFAVQLATFSGVEQQMRTNDLLAALVARGGGLADLGGWVGMEARVLGGAWFDGSPITLEPDSLIGVERVELLVRDAFDAVVDRRDLPAGGGALQWEGIGSDGMVLPEGRYRFEMVAYAAGQPLEPLPVASYQRVAEARIEGGQRYLVLPGGLMVAAEDVSGLRRPAG